MNNKIVTDGDYLIFQCPHCNDTILVKSNELNCRIFRHAVYKDTYTQVNPHLPQDQCEYLRTTDTVYGCCKPFKISLDNLNIEQCGWI